MVVVIAAATNGVVVDETNAPDELSVVMSSTPPNTHNLQVSKQILRHWYQFAMVWRRPSCCRRYNLSSWLVAVTRVADCVFIRRSALALNIVEVNHANTQSNEVPKLSKTVVHSCVISRLVHHIGVAVYF